MADELATEAMDVVVLALDNNPGAYEVRVAGPCSAIAFRLNLDGQVACKQIKELMDKNFGASWHVIIGEGFGFEVTHQREQMIYIYYMGTRAILLFKC